MPPWGLPGPRRSNLSRVLRKLIGALILLAVAFFVWRAIEPENEASVPAPDRLGTSVDVGAADQVVMVTSDAWDSERAVVTVWERKDATAAWTSKGEYPARVGRAGFAPLGQKTEDDGRTPAGAYFVSAAFGRPSGITTGLPYTELTNGDCWISTPGAPDYDRWVRRDRCQLPDVDLYAGRDGRYRLGAVVAYHAEPPGPIAPSAGGSAVFLQVETEPRYETNGVVLAEDDLRSLLATLDLAKAPRVVLGPREWLFPAVVPADGATDGLRRGDQGEQVRELQQLLTDAGFPTKVDGLFGEQTDASVRAFQRREGLTVDGVVGPRTAEALGLDL
jgi:L,D-peptidoglycan transpeptidase YkuD (ErfK/YbiS/YcfS/YnhG family)